MKQNIITGIAIFVAVIALSAMVYNWYSGRFKPPVSQSQYVVTPEIKKAVKIDHEKILLTTTIDVLKKQQAIEKLNINDPVKSDDSKQITATAEIQPYDGKTNVLSILDTKMGTTEIVAKQVPMSFFGFENKKRIGMRGGFASYNMGISGEGYASWTFFRVGKVHTSLYGEVGHDSKAMVDLYFEF
jgi:hypothetical protein